MRAWMASDLLGAIQGARGLNIGYLDVASASHLKCSLDELVVGRDPAVGGEDHELEAGADHLAIR